MKKRFISLLLAAAMLTSVIPTVTVSAADEPVRPLDDFHADKVMYFDNVASAASVMALADTNTYTEYLYIHNVEELKALDGHDGGYYELAADITFKDGEEWTPIRLTNAVFEGKGHWIYNFKQSGDNCIGLFDWHSFYNEQTDTFDTFAPEVYMRNVNFSDMTINAGSSGGSIAVYPMGGLGVVPENCYFSGKINVNTANAPDAEIEAMSGAVNCNARVDISVNGSGDSDLSVCAIGYDSKNCKFAGDINIAGSFKKVSAEGISYASDCTYIGDTAVNISIPSGTSFVDDIFGQVPAKLYIHSMTESENCAAQGDIDINYAGPSDMLDIWSSVLSGCTDAEFTGDVRVNARCSGESPAKKSEIYDGSNIDLFGFYKCTGCTLNGNTDVRANTIYDTSLIGVYEKSEKCALNGDLSLSYYHAEGSPEIVAAKRSSGSIVKGNLRLCIDNNTRGSDIEGLVSCTDCQYYGNMNMSGGTDTYIAGMNGQSEIRSTTGYTSAFMSKCTNCVTYGDYYGEITPNCIGISSSEGCTAYGSINISLGCVFGITTNSKNCSLYGDVCTASGAGCGINNSTGCYISGRIATKPGDTELVASSATPFMGRFRCWECGKTVNSATDLWTVEHCDGRYWPLETEGPFNDAGILYKYSDVSSNYYVLYYSHGTGSETDTGAPLNNEPEPDPIDYSVQIITAETGKPMAGAKATIDGQEYIADDDGKFEVKQGRVDSVLNVLYTGKVVYSDINFKPMKDTLNKVEVICLKIDKDSVDPGSSQEGGMNGPTMEAGGVKYPMFSFPMSINIPVLNNVMVAYDSNRKAYRAVFSTDKFGSDEIKAGTKHVDQVNKRYEDAQRIWQKACSNSLTNADYAKMNTTNDASNREKPDMNEGEKKGLGYPAKFSAMAFMELQQRGDDLVVANGGYVIAGTMGVNYSVPWAVCPIVYFTYGISGTAEIGLTLTLISTNTLEPQTELTGRVSLMVTPSAGVGLGIRKIASVETGLAGTVRADLTWPFESLEKNVLLKMTADWYLMASLFTFDVRASHSFYKWQAWPYKDPEISVWPFDAADPYSGMTSVDRSYLSRIEQDGRAGTKKSNLYPYSKVKTAKLDDRTSVAVWLDDVPTRADEDRTALYYSIITNGTWGTPKLLNDDGTADFEFALTELGDTEKAAVVWQNAGKKLGGVSIADTAKYTDLCYAELSGDTWSQPIKLTSGDNDYEYSPNICSDDNGNAYVIWTQNDANTPFAGISGAKESIYKTKITNKTVGEKTAEYANMVLTLDSAVNKDGVVACVFDKDGDPSTDGCVLQIKDKNITYDKGGEPNSLCAYKDGFMFIDNGSLIRTTGSDEPYTVCTGDAGITNAVIHKGTVYYEALDGINSSIYKMDSSGALILLAEFDERLRSWDIADLRSGCAAVCVLSDIKFKNDASSYIQEGGRKANEISETVRLAYLELKPKQDVEALYITTNDDIKPGGLASFDIGIANRTASRLESVDVTLTDAGGNTLYSGTVQAGIDVAKSGYVTVMTAIPESFAEQKITAEIKTNIDETDKQNNTVSDIFGKPDLVLDIKGGMAQITGCAESCIENVGCGTAKNVVLTIKDENGKTVDTQNVGSVDAGEKIKVQSALSDKLFGSDKAITLYAEVSTDTDEAYLYNNTASCTAERGENSGDDDIVYGDADCDKIITASDALMVLQYTLTPMKVDDQFIKRCDVDKDNVITASDAAYILQATLTEMKLPIK
ncbi:MAG: hypothetical protein IKS17_06575 [Firmicutes bacterium]|nr:hypothetical protein [Bacillota bacterium]